MNHQYQTFWLKVSQMNGILKYKHSGLVAVKATSPISEWTETFRTLEIALMEAGLPCAMEAHAGNGVILAGLLPNREDQEAMESKT